MISDKAGASTGRNFLEGHMSEDEYAEQRGVSKRTCQRDRQLRQAPPYVIVGRRVYYRIDAVRGWLLARERSCDCKADKKTGDRVSRPRWSPSDEGNSKPSLKAGRGGVGSE